MDCLHPYKYAPSKDLYYPIDEAVEKILDWGHMDKVFSKVRVLFGKISIVSVDQEDDLEVEWNYTKKTIYINVRTLERFRDEKRIAELAKWIVFETMNALYTSKFISLKEQKISHIIGPTEYVYRMEEQEFRTIHKLHRWIVKVANPEEIQGTGRYFLDSFPHHLLVQEVYDHIEQIDPRHVSFFPEPMKKGEREILRDIVDLYYRSSVKRDPDATEDLSRLVKEHDDLKNVHFFLMSPGKIEKAWKRWFPWLNATTARLSESESCPKTDPCSKKRSHVQRELQDPSS